MKREWKRKLFSRKLWVGAAMMGIGCALCLSGQTVAGMILIGIGGLGYLISEALVDIARILGTEEATEPKADPGGGTAAGEPEEEEMPDLSEQTAEALREEISTEAADGALDGDTSETTAEGDGMEENAAEETEAEA